MRFTIAGEYKPSGVNFRLVQQHAVQLGESHMAACGYAFGALDRFGSEDWENPAWIRGGMRCERCAEVTGTSG